MREVPTLSSCTTAMLGSCRSSARIVNAVLLSAEKRETGHSCSTTRRVLGVVIYLTQAQHGRPNSTGTCCRYTWERDDFSIHASVHVDCCS
jgi:hypothetical protein